ncbi:MAG: ABC transporter substrate-binding protein [Acetivibrio sp.]
MKKLVCVTTTMFLSIVLLAGCSRNQETTASKKASAYRIGIAQIAPHGSLDHCREGFIDGLKEEGFIEGENLTIDYKNAEGDPSNAAMIADTFVSKKYDLLCGIATPTAMACYNATIGTDIPVIFTAVSDPIAAELVESMENPGTHCSGTSDSLPLEQQMQLIRGMMPDAKVIGILYTTSEVNSSVHLEKFKKLAPDYGFTIEAMGVNSPSDIPLALDTLLTKCDVINNFTDNNVVNNLDTLLAKANEAGIPVFGSEEEQVKKGCVAAANINYYELGKTTGKMAADVLKGDSIENMPVAVISACTPVANPEVLDRFGLQIPEEYKDTVTYLTDESIQ